MTEKPKGPEQVQAPPSLAGMSPEVLQIITQALAKTSAVSVREALRSDRKENPFYHERSAFNPAGIFDDDGQALPAKIKLSRDTLFVGVKLSDELLTPEEIELCNRFTEDKQCRNGEWTATIEQRGSKTRLRIAVPSKTIDDRMGLPPLTHILRELLDGDEAVNPDKMHLKIAALETRIKQLETGQPTAA